MSKKNIVVYDFTFYFSINVVGMLCDTGTQTIYYVADLGLIPTGEPMVLQIMCS